MEFLFSINNVLFTVIGYPMTAVELIGTAFGLWCVWLAAKERVLNYPIGIVNIIFFFVLFYQVQLYSDMLLQVYFFIASIAGWYIWTHPRSAVDANKNDEKRISLVSNKYRIVGGVAAVAGTIWLGTLVSNFHVYWPNVFTEPAAYPYWDAFTTILSIIAMVLMALKKLESWVLWITADIIDMTLYHLKDIELVAIEYVIFGLIATLGLYNWSKEYSSYE